MRTRAIAISSTVCALVLATASPAAADSGVTNATITVTGGVLSITTPASVALGTLVNTVAGDSVSGSLGQVRVSDARGAVAGSGWVTTVISSAFTPPAGPAIAASHVSYSTGDVVKVGTATFENPGVADMTAEHAAVTATGITGDNSATWNPTINVHVAGGTVAGTYRGTITHSLT